MRRVCNESILKKVVGMDFTGKQILSTGSSLLLRGKTKKYSEVKKRHEEIVGKYSSNELPRAINRYLSVVQNLKNLTHLSIIFEEIGQFEQYLLINQGLLKCPDLMPARLNTISIKFDFKEFKIDDYYSNHLVQ